MKFRKKALALAGCFALGVLLACGTNVKQQNIHIEKSFAQPNLVQQVSAMGEAGTVLLISKAKDGTGFTGSGFLIRPDLVVTNVHVVSGVHGKSYSRRVKSLKESAAYTIKGVMASDPIRDLVILKVEGEGAGTLAIGDSDALALREEVIAVGALRQKGGSVESKTAKGAITRTTPDFLSIKTKLLPGHSGGPVLNSSAEVIGISAQGGTERSSGIAVPSNHLKALLNDMSAAETPLDEWEKDPLIRAYAYIKLGNAKERDNDYIGAAKAYGTAVRLSPDFAGAYTKRALLKSVLGRHKSAIADWNAAIRLGMDYPDVFAHRGAAKNALGNYQGAIEDCNIAIGLEADYAQAYVYRGNAKKGLEDLKGAVEDYDAAIRLKPHLTNDALAAAHLKRADVKSALGENSAAIEDCDAVIYLKPKGDTLALAHFRRAEAKSALAENSAAIEDYDEVIRLKPKGDILATAHLKRADAKAALGENETALEDYDQAIQLKPANVIVLGLTHFKRADVKVALGKTEAALKDYDQGIRLVPIDALRVIGYVSRAEAKSNLGDDAGVIADCDAAIRIDPNYAEAYYKRGRAKISIGNTSEAKADLQTALKLAVQENDKFLETDIAETLRELE